MLPHNENNNKRMQITRYHFCSSISEQQLTHAGLTAIVSGAGNVRKVAPHFLSAGEF